MALLIDHELEIDAPPALVWQVLVDLPAYPEWNPFTPRVESSLAVGEAIVMWVRILPFASQRQREVITAVEPGKRLCWGLGALPWGALRSSRCHELRAGEGGGSHYGSRFRLEGGLSPVAQLLLGGRLRRGFGAAAQALKLRAESLAGAEGRDHHPCNSGSTSSAKRVTLSSMISGDIPP